MAVADSGNSLKYFYCARPDMASNPRAKRRHRGPTPVDLEQSIPPASIKRTMDKAETERAIIIKERERLLGNIAASADIVGAPPMPPELPAEQQYEQARIATRQVLGMKPSDTVSVEDVLGARPMVPYMNPDEGARPLALQILNQPRHNLDREVMGILPYVEARREGTATAPIVEPISPMPTPAAAAAATASPAPAPPVRDPASASTNELLAELFGERAPVAAAAAAATPAPAPAPSPPVSASTTELLAELFPERAASTAPSPTAAEIKARMDAVFGGTTEVLNTEALAAAMAAKPTAAPAVDPTVARLQSLAQAAQAYVHPSPGKVMLNRMELMRKQEIDAYQRQVKSMIDRDLPLPPVTVSELRGAVLLNAPAKLKEIRDKLVAKYGEVLPQNIIRAMEPEGTTVVYPGPMPGGQRLEPMQMDAPTAVPYPQAAAVAAALPAAPPPINAGGGAAPAAGVPLGRNTLSGIRKQRLSSGGRYGSNRKSAVLILH